MDKFKTPTIEGKIGLKSTNKQSVTTGNFDIELATSQTIIPARLISDVTVYAWGRNEHGELGLGTKINTNNPQPVVQLKGMPIQFISTGYF